MEVYYKSHKIKSLKSFGDFFLVIDNYRRLHVIGINYHHLDDINTVWSEMTGHYKQRPQDFERVSVTDSKFEKTYEKHKKSPAWLYFYFQDFLNRKKS